MATHERTLVFELRMPIRWGDMDAMGHVNNAVYFRYLEQLRISWFEAMGFAPDPGGQGPVIVNASCDFVRELVYPGELLLKQYVGALGRSSVDTTSEILRIDAPGVVHARGAAKVVWVDYPKRKSAPLPDDVRRKLVTPFVRPA